MQQFFSHMLPWTTYSIAFNSKRWLYGFPSNLSPFVLHILTGPLLLTGLHLLKYNSPHFPTQISIWSFTPSKFAKWAGQNRCKISAAQSASSRLKRHPSSFRKPGTRRQKSTDNGWAEMHLSTPSKYRCFIQEIAPIFWVSYRSSASVGLGFSACIIQIGKHHRSAKLTHTVGVFGGLKRSNRVWLKQCKRVKCNIG